ncbi:hypothetical protein FisN_2Lh276 [Fistulifera solaris]|uniref:Uncharacterized protein n=1 Tax=Fistulifera solaris TaxID=1519565 RepID=A0A1Z5KFB8_FISSO|nr:hypothetical protein FisN_2Lh276 [Fistulifera solaris]|eukprot:GAX24993.1 hypothetical protein FisN_2Lh276 [Fistulifera solaris]
MVIAGIMNLSDASKAMTKGLDKARHIALSGAILIEDFLRNQNLLIRNMKSYRATMNGFCPQVAETVCEQLSPISNCTFTKFSETIRVFLWTIFIDLGTYTFFELTSIQNDLVNAADSMSSVKQGVNGFTWAFWTACVWALLLMIFTMFLMYGVILAWCEERRQSFLQCVVTMMHHWLVVPLYIFFVFLTWVFSMIFVIGTALTADFCFDSPDSKILTTIDANRERFSELGVEFATYYVSGCPESGLPNELKSKSDLLVHFLLKVSEFGAALQSDEVIEICGDTSRFKGVGASLEAATCNVANTLLDVQDYFACQNFHPVYEATVYEALCYEANRGLTWVAFTQILIVFLSMIMLMLRVAFVEVYVDNMSASTNSTWNRLLKLLCLQGQKSLNEETSKEQVYEANRIEIESSKVRDDLNSDC